MSEDLGGYREIIRPGAFDKALAAGGNVIARTHHDSAHVLGTTKGGTLKVWADERGLAYEVDVPDTGPGRDTLELVKRGDITQSSFAFGMSKDGQKWAKGENGSLLREILSVSTLVDVAPVIEPAYPETSVSVRDIEEARAELDKAEERGVPNQINELRLRLL
jgi:HK97 family phage prohead protease